MHVARIARVQVPLHMPTKGACLRKSTHLPRCLLGFGVTVGGLRAQERDALTQGVVMVSIGVVLLQDGRESLAAAAFQQVL